MSRRNALRGHIREAWGRTIRNDYDLRLVNNEAGLQASFVSNLRAVFEEEGFSRTIFVEPAFRQPEEELKAGHYIPDVVVCSDRKIIGLIELKYGPRGAPMFSRDVKKLCDLFSRRADQSIQLSADRYRGPAPRRTFTFSTDILLCYCVVHSDEEVDWLKALNGCRKDEAYAAAWKSLQFFGASAKERDLAEVWTSP